MGPRLALRSHRRSLTGLVVSLALGLLAAPAYGHDSDAPRGAAHNWLPREDWVMERWLPFDEARLHALLGTDRREVALWLRNDHRTLAQLARQHGRDPRALANELVRPRRAEVSAARFRILRARTGRMLTQGHLAQHMFFHLFHEVAIPRNAPLILGVSTKRFRALRRRGMSQLEIGSAHGRAEADIRDAALAVLATSGRRGLRRGASSAAQTELDLAHQRARVGAWMKKKPAKDRPYNPPAHPVSASASAGAGMLCAL